MLRVPGHLFFSEAFEAPDSGDREELDSFAELNLESISPLPVDQLYWGYLHHSDARRVLVYAAHRGRLAREGFDNLESYHHVLPDFATVAGARFPELTDLVLECPESHSLLRFERGEPVPSLVHSRPPAADNGHGDLREATLGMEIAAAERAITAEDSDVDSDGRVTFHHRPIDGGDGGSWETLSPSSDELWAADIRSGDFKTAERSRRRKTRLIIRVIGYAAILALLMLVSEIALLGANLWLDGKRRQVDRQAPEVVTIADRNSLKDMLQQVTQEPLRPIEILALLNDARPNSIYFTEATVEGGNRVTVDGIARRVNEFNQYIDKVTGTGRFELVENPTTIIRGGTVTFTVELTYLRGGGAGETAAVQARADTRSGGGVG